MPASERDLSDLDPRGWPSPCSIITLGLLCHCEIDIEPSRFVYIPLWTEHLLKSHEIVNFFSLKWYHTIISLVKQCDNTVLFASYKQTLIGISWELSSLLINLSIILCNCKQCCILAVGSNEYYNWAMWCRSYCLPIFERKNIKVLWDLGCINIYSIQFYLNVGSHQRKLGLSRNKEQYFMRVWLHWNSF